MGILREGTTNPKSKYVAAEVGRADARVGPAPSVLVIFVFLAVWSFPLCAAESATITYTQDFPNSSPDHYSIEVRSDGHAHYESSAKVSPDSDDQTYQADFTLSDPARTRIFELAGQAHYFSGKIDSGKKKLAFTGAKKLVYSDGARTTAAEYNYSPVPAVQELTTLFQGLSGTLEFGRRLTYFHRYQKLALDDELKQMEDQARSGQLIDLSAVSPVLQQIYQDPSVMNVVRARALRILQMTPAATASK